MSHTYILHMFTPAQHISPFDVNMAADAGYQLLPGCTEVGLDQITALTQDAIFSRSPKGLAHTAIFIGGRDAILAADMLDQARAAMFKPFMVSLMADPSGAYTTAAGMVASVVAALQAQGQALAGQRVVIMGGTGPVGRIAAVLAAQAGADVALSSHGGLASASKAAEATGQRFGVRLGAVSGADREAVRAALAGADVLLACAAAGVQVVTAQDLTHAKRLKVAADVNAVPPEGIAGVGVKDNAKPLAGTQAVGIGALAIGNVKYQTQNRLLKRMAASDTPLVLSFTEAFETAQAYLQE
ncbi:MAG: methylenetetrahydromethanopterin dehydrogenase [Proteobacteria bacterium]|nr:methylenetetrahydromethanopterin dehydrogenase [Pseudomonadota bacterium]